MSEQTNEKQMLEKKYRRYCILRRVRVILAPFVIMLALMIYGIGSVIVNVGANQYVDKDPGDEYKQCIEEKLGVTLPDDLVIEEVEGGSFGFSSSDRSVTIVSNYTIEQWKELGLDEDYFSANENRVDPDGKANGSTIKLGMSSIGSGVLNVLSGEGEPRNDKDDFKVFIVAVPVVLAVIAVFPIVTIQRNKIRKQLSLINGGENS